MKKKGLIVGILVWVMGTTASASTLPNWAKASTKNAAFNQFVEWMQDGPFYRITEVETAEIKLDSGQDAVRVRIHFDDSKGCKARYLNADCVPFEDALFCSNALTDCKPNQNLTSSKLLKLN